MNHDDTRFDSAMRALHGQAVDHVSPQVRQRLRVARTAPSRAPRALGWGLASGCAALLGLVIGLQLYAPPRPAVAPLPGDAPVAADVPSTVPVTEPAGLAAIEQNPDFYLWLASAETTSLTTSLE